MKIQKVTSILLVILVSLSLLNFILKYYTYFVLIISSTKSTKDEINSIAQETGEVPHPHDLFVPLLTFIPTNSAVITRPWVILTSSFIEDNLVNLTLSFMLIFYLGKYLETLWGSNEFTKFILIIALGTNLTLYLYYHLKSFLSSRIPPVVDSATAINISLLVALKQRIPNHYFLLFKGNLRVKVTFFPFILIGVLFFLQLFFEAYKVSFLMCCVAFTISWTYLRFFKTGTNERQSYLIPFSINKKRADKLSYRSRPTGMNNNTHIPVTLRMDYSQVKGDRSDQFAFYTFFPYPLSVIVQTISNSIFYTLVRHKLLDKNDFICDYDLDDPLMFEDLDNLQSKLFELSSLKGAGNVSAMPNAIPNVKKIWNWFASHQPKGSLGIKNAMDKRRKLALKELE